MNTPMTVGNGTLDYNQYTNGISNDASDSPETVCFNVSRQGQIQSFDYHISPSGAIPVDYFNVTQKDGGKLPFKTFSPYGFSK